MKVFKKGDRVIVSNKRSHYRHRAGYALKSDAFATTVVLDGENVAISLPSGWLAPEPKAES